MICVSSASVSSAVPFRGFTLVSAKEGLQLDIVQLFQSENCKYLTNIIVISPQISLKLNQGYMIQGSLYNIFE